MPFGRPFLAAAIALALAPALPAQTRDSVRLREILVTATRTPTALRAVGSSVDLLRPAELARRHIESLRDALPLVPGGVVLMSGGPGAVTSLFLRGVSSTQTLLLVDGIRVNDANTSYGSFLGGADLGGLGHLEIVRGPQSTLYGGAAIGGVVALDAARGEGRAHGSAEMEAGSFSSWRGRVTAQGSDGRFGFTLSTTANGTENQRRPNAWDQRTQLVRLDYRASRQVRLGATLRGLQQGYTSPGDLRTSNTTPAGTTTYENNLGTLWIEATPTARWGSRLILGAQEQFTKGTSRFNGSPESAFTLSNSRWVLDWQNSIPLGAAAVLVAGANREWSTVWSGGAPQDERLLGLYAEAQLTPLSAVTVTAGVRSDDYNTFASAWTYRMTAAWRVGSGGTKLRGSYGTGFMPPSLAARFGSGFQNPNPGIRPERSRGWDAGVDQMLFGGRGAVGATYFHNALRDLIGFESAPFPALGRNVNIDRARTSGLEVSGRVEAGPVDARLAYTLLSATSLSEVDPSLARLIRRPRHTLGADAGIAVTPRAVIGAGLALVAHRQDADFNSFPSKRVDPGDYAVARLYGSYDVSTRFTLRARMENLTNTRYEPVYGFPGLGRSLSGSAVLRF